MQFKVIVLLALITSCCIGGYILFKNIRTERDTSTFVVGMTAGYAPFISINEKGEYEGFDIDVAQAVAASMNKKLVFKDLGSMAPLMIALEQGSIDAIIWGLSITQDRLQKIAMIHYQGEPETTHPLIFWKQIPAGIKGFADMQGMTVCVEPASSQNALVSTYKDIIALPTEKIDDALLAIQYGKAIAAFVDPAIAKKFKAKFPELKILDIPLGDNQVQGVGIAIKKDNSALVTNVQNAVNELKSSGVIAQYEKKWGME